MVEEVTALWVAFGPKDHDEVEGAKFKGATLVRQAKQALKDPDHPWVLGVLVKVPTKETKERLKIEYTPEAFAEARAAWLRDGAPSGQEPKHAWTLMEFDEKQAERAGKYVKAWDKKNNTNPFSQPAAD